MRRFITFVTFIFIGCGLGSAARPYVAVLGVAQDAGIPQMGCETPFCKRAWKDSRLHQMVASLALVDPNVGARWIFDATPDLPNQFQLLKSISSDSTNRLDGIFLTHAHIGHYTGLMYLGREAMNETGVPVYAMPRMQKMLEENAPWSQLVVLNNISLRPLADHIAVKLGDRLSVEPFLVPHRDEFSETVGFRIVSDKKALVYIPDIDKWNHWKTSLTDVVKAADFVLIDGTFFADGEISRPMSEVPHPFVSETMALLAHLPLAEREKVRFIHFNHSNPLIQGDRQKLALIRKKGFAIATRARNLNFEGKTTHR